MRNLTKMTAVAAAMFALGASNAHAEPSMDKSSTIQVDTGNGMKPYKPQKPPAGPTGISVDTGNGWQPYHLKPKPGHGISVDDGKGGWKPYNKPAKPPAGPSGISVMG